MDSTDDTPPGRQQDEAAITAVRDAYEARILRLLNKLRDHLVRMGYRVAGPGGAFDFSDDVYRWALTMRYPASHEKPGADYNDSIIDCVVQLVESRLVDEALSDGINFDFHMSEWGGRHLYAYAPYNFTPEVWVPAHDLAAVEARFRLFEALDADMVLTALSNEEQKSVRWGTMPADETQKS